MSDVEDDGIIDLTTGDDDVVDDGIPIDLTADDTGDIDIIIIDLEAGVLGVGVAGLFKELMDINEQVTSVTCGH